MHASDLLSHRAHLTPYREAILEIETGRRFNYQELNQRANRLANFMRDEFGIEKGDRVSILAQNSIVYLDLFYGLAKIGAIIAPLNWRLTAKELDFIINDCAPKVILTEREFGAVFEELRRVTSTTHPARTAAYISLDGKQTFDAAEYDQLIAAASDEEPVRPDLDAEDTYCILYTSGTTGKPKGAMIPHRQVLWNCINTVISWGLTEKDVSPVYTPLFHAGGLFAFLTPLMYVGGRILLAKSFDVEASLQDIVNERCSVILGVPTLFQLWMNSPKFTKINFSHVHFFISGGAACPVDLMQTWRKNKGVVFRQGYGLTEVGPNCFSMTDEDSVPKSGSVGKPIFHSKMRLVDPETGQDVPVNEPGELLISGPHVTTGYWHNPEATAKTLEDGWFHTGDMACKDKDGFYYIIGRYKDMIKSGGENVYAAEVEAVFREHPAVADCALIAEPHEKWGEVGLMVVVLKTGANISEDEFKEFCADKLARFKIPKRIVLTDGLPYSPYGKVEKIKLKERYVVS
jgi:fatty-acyl-CoA synthase